MSEKSSRDASCTGRTRTNPDGTKEAWSAANWRCPEGEEVGVAKEQHVVLLNPLDIPGHFSRRASLTVLPLCTRMMQEKNDGRM